MLSRHGKTGKGHNIRAVVLDYPVIEQWTGGFSNSGMRLQIPSYFYKPTDGGAYTCASYETLQSTDTNLEYLWHDSDDQGPAWWHHDGHKYLKKPLFTADIFAYGGKHTRCFELWMIDGEHITTDDITRQLISWHYVSGDKDYRDIDVNCISSEFILSQHKNMDPSTFIQLCRDNCVKKIPAYKSQIILGPTYGPPVFTKHGIDLRYLFGKPKPRCIQK